LAAIVREETANAESVHDGKVEEIDPARVYLEIRGHTPRAFDAVGHLRLGLEPSKLRHDDLLFARNRIGNMGRLRFRKEEFQQAGSIEVTGPTCCCRLIRHDRGRATRPSSVLAAPASTSFPASRGDASVTSGAECSVRREMPKAWLPAPHYGSR
jgi:hypothetical protein